MDPESDASVIAASCTEPARFGTIFDRHASLLYRYLARRAGVNEADGMLGELFRIAFERRDGYDVERADARPWLYGIATNLLANHRRREARRMRGTARLLAAEVGSEDPSERTEAKIDAADRWPRVADAVGRLPPAERDTLFLYAWEGLSYEEVASSLEIPVGTVRSRINRARRRIRELEKASGEEQMKRRQSRMTR